MCPVHCAAAVSVAVLVVTGPLAAQSDSAWRDHNRAADASIARGDWADARRHLVQVDRLLGGHPGVALSLARAAVRLGDTAGAIRELERIAAMGVTSRAATADTTFAALRALPAYRAAVEAIASNGGTVGSASVVATLPDSEAIAEDLAWDARRNRFLVTDVRGHRLWALTEGGRGTPLGPALPAGWAMLGIALDQRRGVLWVSAATLPQAAGYTPADSGRAAILRLDPASGARRARIDFPAPTRAAPGDLAVAPNGDLLAGDGQTGAVYVVRAGRTTLDTLVPPGRMRGTQQPAVLPDGRTLFIADYGRGIARVDRAGGAVRWLARGPDVTLTGIDGLLWDGQSLIAVQNGVNPARVVRLTLNDARDSITGAAILLRDSALAPDPTHALLSDEYLYVIGNAGWNKYDDNGAPRRGVPREPPRIIRIALLPGTAGDR